MRITRQDVANKAGVSVATVSYVMNGSRQLTDKTRKRVLKAVEELGYTPDMVARSMVTNKSMQLSIIVNDIVNPFFGEIVLGFEKAAIENGYFVNVFSGFKSLDEYLDNLLARRIDGVFITAIPVKFHMDKLYALVDAGIKVVVSGNVKADLKKVSSIENDQMESMNRAFDHLHSLGHTEIAYLTGLSRNHDFVSKTQAYVDCMKKFGHPEPDSLLFDGYPPFNTSEKEGYHLTTKLLRARKKCTAIISANDFMAYGCLRALAENGINVPKDMSVMTLDDSHLSSMWNPSITAVTYSKNDLGEKAFHLLYNNINMGTTGYYLNRAKLTVRESTGPCSK